VALKWHLLYFLWYFCSLAFLKKCYFVRSCSVSTRCLLCLLTPWLFHSLHLPSETLVSLVSDVLHLLSCPTPVSPLYVVPLFPFSVAGLLSFFLSSCLSSVFLILPVSTLPTCPEPWFSSFLGPCCFFVNIFLIKEHLLLFTLSPACFSADELLHLAPRDTFWIVVVLSLYSLLIHLLKDSDMMTWVLVLVLFMLW